MARHRKEHQSSKQIAQTLKWRLTIFIAFLIVLLLSLMFKIGEVWWPAWMVGHRTQIEGIILLAIISFILFSPIVVEAGSNPRTLSGPGKNPKGPPGY